MAHFFSHFFPTACLESPKCLISLEAEAGIEPALTALQAVPVSFKIKHLRGFWEKKLCFSMPFHRILTLFFSHYLASARTP